MLSHTWSSPGEWRFLCEHGAGSRGVVCQLITLPTAGDLSSLFPSFLFCFLPNVSEPWSSVKQPQPLKNIDLLLHVGSRYSSSMSPIASGLKGKFKRKEHCWSCYQGNWYSSSPSFIIYSGFPSPSAITSIGLGGFPGWYDTNLHFLGWGCYMCLFTVTRGQVSPRDSQVDHLFPQVSLLPPGITAALLSAKIVAPLLACVAQDTRKPRGFDGGYSLQFNKPPDEDVA